MTEVALRTNGGAVAVADQPTAAVVTLADWASELDAAGQIAIKLCQTPFVPKHFQGKPADAAAAILTGHELGLSPMASLRSIFMISGTPGMYAKVMLAVVQAQGHEVWVAEQSADRVVVKGKRRGSDHVAETVWDRNRVVAAKLTNNAKYQEAPQQMMVARGTAEICRLIAADALHGIPYTVEELEDLPPVRAEATAGPRVTAAEILGVQVDSPPQDPQATVDNQPAPVVELTREQLAENFDLFTAAGYNSKAEVLEYISNLLGRTVAARTELTPAELDAVNARLRAVDEPPTTDEDGGFDELGPNLLSVPQRNHIMALAGELGLTDRDARLEYISGIVGQPVASTNDLLRPQAHEVIETMLAAKAAQDAAGTAPEKTLAETAKSQAAQLRRTRGVAAPAEGTGE